MNSLSPDVKRALRRALDEGTLDPDDTLSSGEVRQIEDLLERERFTYRLFVDFTVDSWYEPNLDVLTSAAHEVSVGLAESDAFPLLQGCVPNGDGEVRIQDWGISTPTEG